MSRPAASWTPPFDRLHGIVQRLAGDAADRVILRDVGHALTGGSLQAAVEELAAQLAAAGLRPGDRLAVVGENGVALALCLFAASRLDAWGVPVNARLTGSEIGAILAHAAPRLVLFTLANSPDALRHATQHEARPFGPPAWRLAVRGPLPADPEPVAADARAQVAALLYTSGTTGRPKGVMLSHANLLFVAEQAGAIRRLSPTDRVYCALPLSHVFGLAAVFLSTLLYGGMLQLVPRFEAEAAARALAEDGITLFQGVPVMFGRLLALAERRGAALAAPQLRCITTGGAPVDPALRQRVEAMWGLPLLVGYGLTETASTLHTLRPGVPAPEGTVGTALPFVEQRIVDPASGRELPTGEIGELCVRGPGVMLGYYRDPKATRSVLGEDGFLRTGDLGCLDAAGGFRIVGRLKELIVRSGFKVHPPEVEAAIMAHPDVAVAAVMGRPTGDNEEVVAVVEPVPGRVLDTGDLARFVAGRLAPYKRPTRWIVVEELPKTPANKVLKARLRPLIEGAGEVAA